MSFYRDRILASQMPKVMGSPDHMRLRAATMKGLRGRIVEVGFGAGLNLVALPDAVRAVHAVDPDRLGRSLAAERIAASHADVHFTGLDGESIPLPDASMDAALSTWTICTIPNMRRALSELRRVLKPGGRLHFLEHGKSPDASLARWQCVLNPFQRLYAGGCRLNVDMAQLLVESGFQIASLDNFMMPGPRYASYMYQGIAVSPGAPIARAA